MFGSFLILILNFIIESSVCQKPPESTTKHDADKKVLMCYFGSWSTWRHDNGFFDVENIDPFLCTHLIFGFAGLDAATNKIKALNEYNDLDQRSPHWSKGAYRRFTSLKQINPNLFTLLAIGGWNEGVITFIQ
jgi:chitinase